MCYRAQSVVVVSSDRFLSRVDLVYTISRWRRWAINRGVPRDKLQKWAVSVGLTWPKDSIFEKTESRIDK